MEIIGFAVTFCALVGLALLCWRIKIWAPLSIGSVLGMGFMLNQPGWWLLGVAIIVTALATVSTIAEWGIDKHSPDPRMTKRESWADYTAGAAGLLTIIYRFFRLMADVRFDWKTTTIIFLALLALGMMIAFAILAWQRRTEAPAPQVVQQRMPADSTPPATQPVEGTIVMDPVPPAYHT